MTLQQAARFGGLIAAALDEDGAGCDITSSATLAADSVASAEVVFRSGGVVAGMPVAALTFATVDPMIRFDPAAADGNAVPAGTVIATLLGPARSVLAAERVALNFLGRLSGIASLTRTFVDAVAGFPVRICDTRKTTPGLRALERYAVRAGGGFNHRFNLSDAVLIKDNHVAAVGSVAEAVAAARANAPAGLIVEIECDSLQQVQSAVAAGVDAVLLDNMPLEELRRAVAVARGRAAIEASGGITLDNVRAVAQAGVDIISVGALTHSPRSADIALDFRKAL